MAVYTTKTDVAVIEVNNPPVNALSFHVRKDIQEGIERANRDAKIRSIVICGKGTFIAGADIREFSTGEHMTYPTIGELTFVIEESKKPVISAVRGFALGGGLEIALSSHYRIGHQSSQYGFPEVNIGILPAATGTQRLPRVAGLKAALDLIPTGRRFTAKEAMKIGVLDKVSTEKDFVTDALDYARSVAGRSLTGRHTTRGPVKEAEHADSLMQAALEKAQKKSPGLLAPIFNIKSVMASVQFPRDEALEKEREYAMQLFTSYQSRALQYAFFSERAATKWDIPGASYKTAKPTPLKTGAVVGAGIMGSGIAMAMLNSGMPVVLLEQNQKFLEKGVELIKSLYGGSVRLGKMTKAKADMCLGNLKPTVNYEDVRNVDVVVEAVFEDMSVKKDVFRKLDKICSPKTYLWSNTSGLDVDEIGSATTRPDKVLGAHFFVPAYHMRLLENVRSKATSPETIATAMEFGVQIGKVPVLVGNCPGFVGNRMQMPMIQEAFFMLEEGCLPTQLDQVHEDFGFPMGVMKVRDLAGGHIGFMSRKIRAKKLGVTLDRSTRYISGTKYSALPDMLCEAGRTGRAVGKGWYTYEKPNAKVPFVDEAVHDMIISQSKFLGITRETISTQEITERLYYALINEGFKILEEGMASKPEDIDTIWLLGYAWPRQYGGPMFYADMIGIDKVYERVCHYWSRFPSCPYWQPSKLLERVAREQLPLKQWAQAARNSDSSKL